MYIFFIKFLQRWSAILRQYVTEVSSNYKDLRELEILWCEKLVGKWVSVKIHTLVLAGT